MSLSVEPADKLLDSQSVNLQHPWPGLSPYTEELQGFFHGRGREVDELLRRVRRKVLTILCGQSGLGKTSLLQAGLVPRLRQEAMVPVLLRIDYAPEAPAPALQIKAAIATAVTDANLKEPAVPGPQESLWEYFHRTDHTWLGPDGKPVSLVLVFDQFEELFTLGQATAQHRARAAALVDELVSLVENRAPAALEQHLEDHWDEVEKYVFNRQDFRVLVCLREDYLAQLMDIADRLPSLAGNPMRLTQMNGHQALEAVLEPARGLVSPDVALQIVRFVAGEQPSSAVTSEDLSRLALEPSLLSLVCRELNSHRLKQGLSQISADLLAGSRDRILQDFYEGCLAGQPAAVRDFVEDELLTDSGFRIDMPLEQAHKNLATRGAAPGAIDELVKRRLLHLQDRLNIRRVELTHDVLSKVIQKSRDIRQQRKRVQALREKLRQTRIRMAVAIILLVALGLIGFGIWYGSELSRALDKEHAANEELKNTNVELKKAREAAEDAGKAEKNQREQAEFQRKLADAEREKSRDYAVRLAVANGARALEENDVSGALLWFADALNRDQDNSHPVQSHRRRLGISLETMPRITRVWAQPSKISFADFSPDGQYILSTTEDGAIALWTMSENDPVWQEAQGKRIVQTEFNSSGKRFVTVSDDGTARIWETSSGKATILAAGNGKIVKAIFSPTDDQQLLTVDERGARIWDLAQSPPDVAWSLEQQEALTAAAFSPDGKRLVVAGESEGSSVWNLETRKQVATMRHLDPVRQLAFSPGDGKWIASTHGDRLGLFGVLIWDANTGKLVSDSLRYERRTAGLIFGPEGKWLLGIGEDRTLQLWQTSELIEGRRRYSDPDYDFRYPRSSSKRTLLDNLATNSAVFSKDGRFLVVAATDNTARVVPVDSNISAYPPMSHGGNVVRASLSPSGRWVLTASENMLRLWDLDRTIVHNPANKAAREVRLVAVGAKGQMALVTGDETVWICDLKTGKRVVPHLFPGEEIRHVELCDGDRLLVGDRQRWQVWDINSGKRLAEIPRDSLDNPKKEDSFAFSPDGGFVLKKRAAELWKVVPRPQLIKKLTDSEPISKAAFSPNGQLLATLTQGEIKLLEVESGKVLHTFTFLPQPRIDLLEPGLEQGVLAFSPDSRFFVYAGLDDKVHIWNASKAELFAEFETPARVMQAEFARDGQLLAIASEDKTAFLWDMVKKVRVGDITRFSQRYLKVRFSPDGSLVAGVSERGADGDLVQVWSTAVGQPVTPPMPHASPLLITDLQFSMDGAQLITIAGRRSVRVWNLAPRHDLKPAEYVALAQIQSGQKMAAEITVRPVPLDPMEFFRTWELIRPQLPPVRLSAQQDLEWHWRELLQCTDMGQWEAALWHLKWIRKNDDVVLASQLLARQADLERKLRLFDEALKHLEKARELLGPDPRLAWDMAALYREKADAQSNFVLKDYQQCQEQLEKLAKANPDDNLTRAEFFRLAESYGRRAQRLIDDDDADSALQVLEQMQQIARHVPDVLDQLPGSILKNIGDASYKQGKIAQALKALKLALKYQENIEKKLSHKDDLRESQTERRKLHENLAKAYLNLGTSATLQAARNHYQQALEIARKQAKEDPENDSASGDVSDLLVNLGWLSVRLGNSLDGYQQYLESVEVDKKRIKDHPMNWVPRESLVYTYANYLIPVCYQLGKTKEANDLFQESLSTCEDLAKDPAATKGAAYRFGDCGRVSLNYRDDTVAARRLWEKHQELLAQVLQDDTVEENLALGHEWLADICLKLGDAKVARKHGEDSVDIREKLLSKNLRSTDTMSHLSYGYQWLGWVARELHDAKAAETNYGRFLALRQNMSSIDSQNLQAKGLLADAYLECGWTKLNFGEAAAALEYHQKAAKLQEERLSIAPKDIPSKAGLASAVLGRAAASFKIGMPKQAAEAYQQLLQLREELLAAEDKNVNRNGELADALETLGEWHRSRGEAQTALDALSKSMARREQLTADLKTSAAERHLATVYALLGHAHLEQHEIEKARGYFEKAERIALKLAEADPENLGRQVDYANGLANRGLAELQAGDFQAAQKWFNQSLAILKKLDDQEKLVSRTNQKTFVKIKQLTAVAEKGEHVLKDLAAAAKEPPDWAAELLIFRAEREVDQGQNPKALQTAEALRKLGPADPNRLYDLARCYARMARSVIKGRGQNLPPADETTRADYFRRAIESLNEAVNKGYGDWATLLSEPDLDLIRSEPGYHELVRQAPSQLFKTEEPANPAPTEGQKLVLKDGRIEIQDELARLDRKDTKRRTSFCKIYSIRLLAGKTYQIDMKHLGNKLDPYLRLEDETGKELAYDDDSGGFPDAQIVFECTRDGIYRIIATSYGANDTGKYSLTVQQK
jgi:WD40 repeat protein/tetratricopeptide (TPR) repeat protein